MFIVQVYLNLKIRYFLSFRKISETLKVVFLVKYELVFVYVYFIYTYTNQTLHLLGLYNMYNIRYIYNIYQTHKFQTGC